MNAFLTIAFAFALAAAGCASTDNDETPASAESHLEAQPVSFAGQRWKANVYFGAAGGEEAACADAPPSGLVCWFGTGATHPPGRLVIATLHMEGDAPEVRLYFTNDNGATIAGGDALALTTHPTTPSDLQARVKRDDAGALEQVSVSAISPFGVYFTRIP